MSGYNSRHTYRGSKMRNSSRSSGRSIPIPLEPLKEGHRIDPQERLFLDAAERGDKHTMIRCLQGPNPVNVNCTNILGRSAIQIAVDNENMEIVEVLLKQEGVKIGDALLYAIREGVYRIVEMLIDHPSITREMLGSAWVQYKSTGEESSDYPPDISPVILAAHCNQFEILQLLLTRGAKIDKPHALTCSCQRCKRELQDDSLRHSLLRIHTYRALASPAWMSLTSSDPVLMAFKLSWELEHLAMRENEFKDIYAELSEQCKKYSCDLLSQCRSSEEVIAVLNKGSDGESDFDRDPSEQSKVTLSRLKLALKYEQKQFVAHPHCQQLLASIWYEGLPGWRKRNVVAKSLIIVGLIALMPVTAVYYLLLPRSQIGQLLRTPFMKFMYHSASFGIFLFLLILASTNVGGSGQDDHLMRQKQRGPPPTVLEWLIVLYVLGFIWAECKQLWEEGLKAYVRQWWNWLDFIMLSLYLCTFALRIVAYYQSKNEDIFGPNLLPRNEWPEADPTLVSEGVFAIANVFSFARIIFLFQANPQLGPLQISLGCMLIDIGKFFVIFFLVITSFACGLNQLYFYYSKAIPTDSQNNAFDPLDTSLFTLFWTLFGLTSLVVLEVKLHYIEMFGKLLFGLYNFAARILLLNMLIAMMAKSFLMIVDHADREWKFARSKLWMGYFDEGSTLPPPFNLIISPKSVYYAMRACKSWLWGCLCGGRQRTPVSQRNAMQDGTIKKRPNIAMVSYTNNHIEDHTDFPNLETMDTTESHFASSPEPSPGHSVNEHMEHNGDASTYDSKPTAQVRYQDVMRRLVSRYIHQWKKQMRQDGVNEDDLLEIKQDISSLRYELREDRKRADARTAGHIDALRREILNSIRTSQLGNGALPPSQSQEGPQPFVNASFASSGRESPTFPPASLSGTFLSQGELDFLKRDIILGLRSELRQIIHEAVGSSTNLRNAAIDPPPLMSPMNGELYQTHLYTQL